MKKILCFCMGYMSLTSGNNFGSELSLENLALQFSKHFEVVIFSVDSNENTTGKPYKLLNSGKSLVQFIQQNPVEIMIVSRYISSFLDYPLTTLDIKKLFIWVHDFTLQPSWNGQTLTENGKHLLTLAMPSLTGIVTQTTFHRKCFIDHYKVSDQDKLSVIGNGIVTQDFKASPKIPGKFVYISAPNRGLDVLLKIIIKLHEAFPHITLHVFRDLDTASEIFKTISSHSSFIFAHGYKPNHIIRQELASAEFWLYPTNFIETYCCSAIEAQMSGCLCIASPIGSLVEVLSEERGVLLNSNAHSYGGQEYIDAVCKTVTHCLDNMNLYQDRIAKAQEWAKNQDVQSMAQKWYKLFDFTPQVAINSFVINMDNKPQRLVYFRESFSNNNLPEPTRVQAVDGQQITWKDVCDFFKIREHNYWYIPHENNAGLIGCAMSHVKCWKAVTETSIIFEDDARPSSDNLHLLPSVIESLSQMDWDICFLGITPRNHHNPIYPQNIGVKVTENLFRLRKSDKDLIGGGSFAYLISHLGAMRLCEKVKTSKLDMPLDWYLLEADNVFLARPFIFHHKATDNSTIQGPQQILKGINNLTWIEINASNFNSEYISFLKAMTQNPYIVVKDYANNLPANLPGVNEILKSQAERDLSFKQKTALITSQIL